ncbi:hypothetical protein B0T14DRAFT_230778 [Immersiella caudata]|uniref:Uncharacterized protein n=1 Tax=Immersiella caudata TaxID=314043 RepID=A0AA40C0H9_9PEZI|nr:hypothetical protein B0T14DRAFT_230778 [Immersiella caudata]
MYRGLRAMDATRGYIEVQVCKKPNPRQQSLSSQSRHCAGASGESCGGLEILFPSLIPFSISRARRPRAECGVKKGGAGNCRENQVGRTMRPLIQHGNHVDVGKIHLPGPWTGHSISRGAKTIAVDRIIESAC